MLAKNNNQKPIRGLRRFLLTSIGYCEICLDEGRKTRIQKVSTKVIYRDHISTVLLLRRECPYGHGSLVRRAYSHTDAEF